jgi:hypothetical protein
VKSHAPAMRGRSTEGGRDGVARFGMVAALFVCLMVLLGFAAPPAIAAPTALPGWAFKATFGELSPSNGETLRNPISIGEAGRIYAVSQNFGAVQIYSPSAAGGSLLTEIPYQGPFPRNVAADPNDGDVYVDGWAGQGDTMIHRFVSDGAPVPTYSLDPTFELPEGESIAVDPTTDDLLVTESGAEDVRRYDATGALVDTINTPGINPAWIAPAPDGSFFVAPPAGGAVTHLSGTGTVLGTISGIGSIHGLAFDSARSTVVVAVGSELHSYPLSGSQFSASPVASGESIGIAAGGPEGRLYEYVGPTINAYEPAIVPDVATPIVSEVGVDSAHVSVEADPGVTAPNEGEARFELSEDSGAHWGVAATKAVPGAGTVEVVLAGLRLNSDLLVRVTVANSTSSKTSGGTPFTTPVIPPVVKTGAATSISETEAVLNGTVNAAGQQTLYRFEYGTTTAYGSQVPLGTDAPAGNQRSPLSVAKLITGLQAGTTYHFRVVAQSPSGVSIGEDKTFTTLTAEQAFPLRAYEQVTPVDKEGATVFNDWHFQTAPDGSAIAVVARSATPDSESNLLRSMYAVRRGQSDWLPWQPLEVPQNSFGAGFPESSVAAVSADFEHTLVISSRVLAPGGVEGGGNLYVKDLQTGAYSFVGGAPGAGAISQLAGLQNNERIYLAGAPDFSWVIFFAEPSLLPEAPGPEIYRWSKTAGLKIESRLDDGTAVAVAQGPGAYEPLYPVTSDGGGIVAFGAGGQGVYRRSGGVSVPISVSQIAGDPATPQSGALDGMTADGRYVFFESPARLTEDAPVSAPGIYGYRYDAQTDNFSFIAMYNGEGRGTGVIGFGEDGQTAYIDGASGAEVWRDGVVSEITPERLLSATSAETPQYLVTPNGRYLAWASGAGELKLYDAAAHSLTCVSCLPNGEPGARASFRTNIRSIGNATPRAVTADGTMFFSTASRLVAADHNGSSDVYAYHDGHLALISPASEDYGAYFVDASEDGSNVFFQTDQALVAQDRDHETDVYDARVNGGFARQNEVPSSDSCSGAECSGGTGQSPAAPLMATTGPASSANEKSGKPARVEVKSVGAGGKALKVRLYASQPGRVKISGPLVRTTEKQLSKAGAVVIDVPLSEAAQARRRSGQPLKVTLTVRLSGSWGSTSAKYSRTTGK